MKKFLIVLFLIPNLLFAECDFSSIKVLDGYYQYPPECHLKVGTFVKTIEVQGKKIKLLEEALTLKDLALKKSEADAEKWAELARKFEERIQTQNNLTKTYDAIHFGLGLLTGFAAVYGASKLR